MNPSARVPAISIFRAAVAAMLWASAPFAVGEETLETARKAALAEIGALEADALFRKLELAKKYVAALEKLEKKLAADGNLDAIVRLREEKELVEKSGETTAHEDKPLAELRETYLSARTAIDHETGAARAKAVEKITAKIRTEEAALTKAGNIDEALALRKAGERMLLELGGGAAAAEVDEPRNSPAPGLKPLVKITVPAARPPIIPDPFAIKGRWMESMTIPAGKLRIRESIVIGDRAIKKRPDVPFVVISPGSVWQGAEDVRIELSASDLVATRSRFANLRWEADLGCKYYFINCAFDNCQFRKGGIWGSGEHSAKFYMENCLIEKRFAESMRISDVGIRAERCVFSDIELPSMDFRHRQPADYVNHSWLRLVHCRFVRCRIPVSFLLLTRDCVFENCTFVDGERHKDEAEIINPIEVVLFVNDCKNRIADLPEQVTLTEKPVSELKGIVIPTAESLTALIDR